MKVRVIIGSLMAMLIIFFLSCQSDEEIEFKRYYTAGKLIYQIRCQNCHADNGEGLSALIPPLTDSAYLKKNRSLLSCYIRNGLKGPLRVRGKSFEGEMAPVYLTPIEVAQVITYINNSFGNQLGVTTAQQVNVDISQCK